MGSREPEGVAAYHTLFPVSVSFALGRAKQVEGMAGTVVKEFKDPLGW